MMEKGHSERIERFLRNQMTPEENEAFMKDMEQDETLRKEAQLTALMIQDLQERQEKRDAEIIEQVVAAKNKASLVRMVKWVASVAALFLIVFGVYWYQSKSAHDDGSGYIALSEQYYDQTPKAVFRGGDLDLEQELDSLFVQVRTSKDMTATIKRLQTIYENVDAEYAYHVNGNDVRIKWFLALAYLKDNQKDKAVELLRMIVKDDKGTDLKQPAERLLKDIDKP